MKRGSSGWSPGRPRSVPTCTSSVREAPDGSSPHTSSISSSHASGRPLAALFLPLTLPIAGGAWAASGELVRAVAVLVVATRVAFHAAMARVLFVCLGNICRSPTAEAVMARLVAEAGLAHAIELDSAGTGAWHVGSPPDERATQAAAARGVAMRGTARQVTAKDFEDFDLLLAMDAENRRNLRALAPHAEAAAKVRMLREFDPASAGASSLDVPDPYYGGADGFDRVLDLVEAACVGLLAELRADAA
jgi:protein-tyrosine phosphatase